MRIITRQNVRINEHALRHYVMLITRFKHTSASALSRKLGHHRSYLNSLLGGRSIRSIINLTPTIARILHVPVSQPRAIINGDFTYLHKLEHQYVQNVLKTGQCNYIWVLRSHHHMSTTELAKKLGVTYDDVCWIQHSVHPQISTVIHIAHIFNVSPFELGVKLHYSPKTFRAVLIARHQANFGRYLASLRHKKGWSQIYVAKLLKMRQSNISRIEKTSTPQIKTLVMCAELYHVSLSDLATHHPYFKNMSKHSPTYKVLQLCIKHNISLPYLTKSIHYKALAHIMGCAIHDNDMLSDVLVTRLSKFFKVPSSYFGKTTNPFKRSMERYRKRTNLKPSDFGYRVQVLRCKRHMTLTELGKRMGVTNSRTQQIVYSKNVNQSTVRRLSNIFKTKI